MARLRWVAGVRAVGLVGIVCPIIIVFHHTHGSAVTITNSVSLDHLSCWLAWKMEIFDTNENEKAIWVCIWMKGTIKSLIEINKVDGLS